MVKNQKIIQNQKKVNHNAQGKKRNDQEDGIKGLKKLDDKMKKWMTEVAAESRKDGDKPFSMKDIKLDDNYPKDGEDIT